MPVEIRELIIRTTVVNDAGEKPGSADSDRSIERSGESSANEATIAACVAQVLKILERKKER